MSQAKPHIIAYDISDPKRLARIHRFLKKQATPLQYSVFYTLLTPVECKKLYKQLENRIDPAQDDVRIYPLPLSVKHHTYGRAWWPENGYMLVQ